MSMLQQLADDKCWQRFCEYKSSLISGSEDAKELRRFAEEQAYLPVCEKIFAGEPFPCPKKTVISKMSTQKKRVVYTYPRNENSVAKLLTYLLLRKYDHFFSGGLYSFRPGRTAKDAVRKLAAFPGISGMHAYKVDISNYFNSVPVDRLLPMLQEITADDPELFAFLKKLLKDPRAYDHGQIIEEEKGIMAGTPLSAFYANIYLTDLDACFAEKGVPYARYSDDIIVFGMDEAERDAFADEIKSFLAAKGLSVNPSKEERFSPQTGWNFLGFSCRGGVIDIAPATLKKLKQKMRRKARALARWRDRKGATGENAAVAFVRAFNRKLLDSPEGTELSWSHWFFSVINTADTLREIDRYAQDCIRFIVSGTRTKRRYDIRYEDMKAIGYRSLVHEYYAYGGEKKDELPQGQIRK
ncbi:MAG: group II intron reverse transcriptase domain-containing protein [Firmicutes bacterium]|nr:group II intron reverse transcriptase domain-containing protein [Bacillota bacterium]